MHFTGWAWLIRSLNIWEPRCHSIGKDRNFVIWKYPSSNDGRSLQTKIYGHIRFY